MAPEPSEVCEEMILGNRDAGIRMLIDVCQRILDGGGILADLYTGVAILSFKRKGDIMNCGIHRGVRLQEHGTYGCCSSLL